MNDDSLLKKAQTGDVYAFEELLKTHSPRMFMLALRLMNNREDALDLTQEAWIRIYRGLPGFRGQSAFSTWIYRIVYNTCLDELRKRKNKTTVSADALADKGISAVVTNSMQIPEEHFENTTRGKMLREALAQLSEDHLSVIVLRDVQGFSYGEIAEILGQSLGTVKSRISRARIALAAKLQENSELK